MLGTAEATGALIQLGSHRQAQQGRFSGSLIESRLLNRGALPSSGKDEMFLTSDR